ncbi:riboflavin synthase [Pelistega europaea]|uniref:Riboflavin synthase n=1 Tax=Pelistega europaea TaxID=106147 RepID=A0A7Y4P606_9BURK|nr:riboflavin synthase [Pelistega europaea]NOL49275.1 riboflavin synthase [Pelistega europaea]
MFTGIVAGVGQITHVEPLGKSANDGVRLTVQANNFDMSRVKLGDSIAIQGACMTVIEFDNKHFKVDVSRESLNKTSGLDATGEVNLEHAMRLSDTVDGHLVSGHVDGLGKVESFEPIGESYTLRIQIPTELSPYMAYKGSVTVNGVSLTVNSVEDNAAGCVISINLIPHTVAVTTLKHLSAGKFVNIEIDTIARYVERMLKWRSS